MTDIKIEECDLLGEDVCTAICTELAYQRTKWGDRDHTAGEWILIIEKLVVDARLAWVSNKGDEKAMHEIRQICATAFAAMSQCGAPKRKGPTVCSIPTIAEQVASSNY